MQFGSEPLFENISAKFDSGNRYGLIGANGCGKSMLMKIMSGELELISSNVLVTPGEMIRALSQDQFAFEQNNGIDAVIMGDKELCVVNIDAPSIQLVTEFYGTSSYRKKMAASP